MKKSKTEQTILDALRRGPLSRDGLYVSICLFWRKISMKSFSAFLDRLIASGDVVEDNGKLRLPDEN